MEKTPDILEELAKAKQASDPLDFNAHISSVQVVNDQPKEAEAARRCAEKLANELVEVLVRDDVMQSDLCRLPVALTSLPLAAHALLASDKALASISTVYMDRFPQVLRLMEDWGDVANDAETHFGATIGKALIQARESGQLQLSQIPVASAVLVQGKVQMQASASEHLAVFDSVWRPWLGEVASTARTALQALSANIAMLDGDMPQGEPAPKRPRVRELNGHHERD